MARASTTPEERKPRTWRKVPAAEVPRGGRPTRATGHVHADRPNGVPWRALGGWVRYRSVWGRRSGRPATHQACTDGRTHARTRLGGRRTQVTQARGGRSAGRPALSPGPGHAARVTPAPPRFPRPCALRSTPSLLPHVHPRGADACLPGVHPIPHPAFHVRFGSPVHWSDRRCPRRRTPCPCRTRRLV